MQKNKIKIRKFKRKAHNFILKTTAGIAVMLAFLSACAIDSGSWVTAIIFLASMGWLAIYSYANDWWDGYEL